MYIDEPASLKQTYNFDHNPPVLDGQTGVPQLVDKILGNKDYFQFRLFLKLFQIWSPEANRSQNFKSISNSRK